MLFTLKRMFREVIRLPCLVKDDRDRRKGRQDGALEEIGIKVCCMRKRNQGESGRQEHQESASEAERGNREGQLAVFALQRD